MELQKEHRRQEDNDKLRREFARQANEFHQWLADTRAEMMEASGSLGQIYKFVGEKRIVLIFRAATGHNKAKGARHQRTTGQTEEG